ncbi:hypothetical protein FUAX_50570 (plasmid) [Fulvitalea axinellae]|uniref:DUF4407 domain-containing protein n=1 Tax=Fulvitalea axinellae TaxID=1182444 RepID=A0AAU9DN81_9BACT|nr:hypothetical protein FUAX_50570 [Fulvitalea axinellae]
MEQGKSPNQGSGKKESANNIFWNLAGFKPEIISKLRVEKYYAGIIGLLLLLVGIYAAMAWTFFFQTVTENAYVPVIGGLFMGFFVICFDRALIASMATGKPKAFPLLFRVTLALLLGVFLSQPMILKFYQPEIKREANLLYLEDVQKRREELMKVHKPALDDLARQEEVLGKRLADKEALLVAAEKEFMSEMDGSGGTGKWGYNKVAKAKEKIANRHREEYDRMKADLDPAIGRIRQSIDSINAFVGSDVATFRENNEYFGTLMQVRALESLMAKDPTGSLRRRYYLLSFILVLIELSGLLAKVLFRTRSYSAQLDLITEGEVKSAEDDLALTRQFLDGEREANSERIKSFGNGKADTSTKDRTKDFSESMLHH